MQNPFPVTAPGHQAISVTPALLFDLLNTARNQCPQCAASGQHMHGPNMAERHCTQCGYRGPEGDWRVGWLCRTLRESVAHMLAIAQGNISAPHAGRPVNIGRNGGPEHVDDAMAYSMRVPRSETIGLCTASAQGFEHVWQPGAMVGREYCRCGAWRTSVQGSRITHVPHGPGLVYVRTQGNEHVTPPSTQDAGNVRDTRVQQGTGTQPLPPMPPIAGM